VGDLLEAAWEVHRFLTARQVPYAIIGGFAVQHWGQPRLTVDLDVTVSVPAERTLDFVRDVISRFTPRVQDLETFARDTRVIPVRAPDGCLIDISLAIPGYEDLVMARTVEYEVEPDRPLRFCSPEDLIIHKAVAGRPLDIQDIEGVIFRQRDALDSDYIRHWLHDFSTVLESPEILERFEAPWRQLHGK
jgi:hypothetical protein